METFVPDREPADAMRLMSCLAAIGLAGRDAAYLASVAPPVEPGSPEMVRYLREFEFMVDHAARAAAAALIGLSEPAAGFRRSSPTPRPDGSGLP